VNPRATITMATRPVDWQRTNGSTSYAQLPSAPRLLHYLLLGAGLRDLSWQTLVISLLGTALTAALLWRLFGQPALLVVPLAVVFDHAGFLAWTLNASRVWFSHPGDTHGPVWASRDVRWARFTVRMCGRLALSAGRIGGLAWPALK